LGIAFCFQSILKSNSRKPIRRNISENNPSKTLKGKVALIEQTFEEANQRFARVRIVLPKFKQFTENKFACYRTVCFEQQ
jgi:hypothetical protein